MKIFSMIFTLLCLAACTPQARELACEAIEEAEVVEKQVEQDLQKPAPQAVHDTPDNEIIC